MAEQCNGHVGVLKTEGELSNTGSVSRFTRKNRTDTGFFFFPKQINELFTFIETSHQFGAKARKGAFASEMPTLKEKKKKKALSCLWGEDNNHGFYFTRASSAAELMWQRGRARACVCVCAFKQQITRQPRGQRSCWEIINWRQTSENADCSHLMELTDRADGKRENVLQRKEQLILTTSHPFVPVAHTSAAAEYYGAQNNGEASCMISCNRIFRFSMTLHRCNTYRTY